MSRGFKVVQIVCVASMGGQGEGSKGPKSCKFQTSSSPDPEDEQSSYVACRYLVQVKNKSFSWQFPGWPQWAPVEGNSLGRGPYVKSNCFIFFLKTHGWILTKRGRNHPWGPGIQSCSYGTCGFQGGPERGHRRAKTLQISNLSPDPV